MLRLLFRIALASVLFASGAHEAVADDVEIDGTLVPLPTLLMEEPVEESGDSGLQPAQVGDLPPEASAKGGADEKRPKFNDTPVVNREAVMQERAARRLSQPPASVPVHRAAPERRRPSVSAEVRKNPLPPSGAAHVAILIASALIAGVSFLFHRWAPKKIVI